MNNIPKYVFCQKCHRATKVPDIAFNVEVQSGFITIGCSNVNKFAGGKETKCGGKIKVKIKKNGS
jgi:hypothetical protein